MFLIKYFKASFQFDTLLTHFDEKFTKLWTYFIVLSLIALFPMNLLIQRQEGFRLDFIEQDFLEESPNWVLPSNCTIEVNRLTCANTTKTVLTHQDVTYIFNGTVEDIDLDQKQLILTSDTVIYTDGKGARMSGSYRGFDETFNFNTYNLMDSAEKVDAMLLFARNIEASFSRYTILYAVLTNTGVSILVQFAFVLLLGAVLQLFRFGYQSFPNYFDGLKFIILSMGLPSLIGFIIGIFVPSFGSVFYQLAMGLTIMIVMLKYGKKCLK
jgi:maltodextrin utilization protein YvdJ